MILTPDQQAALATWYQAQQAAEAAKTVIAREQKLRKELCAALNLSTDEGTRREELPDGWALKYKTPYVRKIDARLVQTLRAPLEAMHVSIDTLVEWKPSLVTDTYRELTAEARAVFDACLTTTAGAPTVELVPPKG